jgi:hypothetical protein
MDKKTTAKVMFLHLIVALLINGIVYSLFNEMFDIPSPLLIFVQVIFVLTTSGSIFAFLVNIVALFGEEEATEKQNQKKKNNDRWIKLK